MNRRWLVVTALALTACLAAGWFAARAFESPAQRQARARPPAPEPIVAAVTVGRLADEITARARIAPAVAARVRPGAIADRAVVTGRPAPDRSPIAPGTALLTINGRPLFVLPGRFRLYRDISDGMAGPDVAQLQSGLAAAGLLAAGAEGGSYGPVTQAAVRALYQAVGAEPNTLPAPTPETRATARRGSADPPPAPELPIVSMNEIAVTPRLPATLASALPVGADVQADRPLATLTSGPLVAHAGVAASVVQRIRPGMDARLVGPGGRTVSAEVLAVRRGGGGRAGDLHDVTLRAVRGALPAAWQGKTVLARIVTTLVRGRALIVPTRAVAQGPEGSAYVLKEVRHGTFTRVRVRQLGSLAGRTAVAPQDARTLQPSDRVRVG
jgi:peptidoglycan hydrolase-like protein with peptidoglycan-binding domain